MLTRIPAAYRHRIKRMKSHARWKTKRASPPSKRKTQ
nr:MAG TPA: hypothetical protein [Caudoviricetes sp.]